ncbi:MAG: hypothetical protein M1818_005357 [Claussenomyces sp. TS43310]|nr:MAG: hypothetical protein M1818_005357 [Claussenomyces sp. TS43310]
MHDHSLPPPPYSATDVSSNADGHNFECHTPTASQGDAASILARQDAARHDQEDVASLADSSIIYTPPYTPDSSCHLDAGVPVPSEDVSSSAAAYFESRPVHQASSGALLIYTLLLGDDLEPEDIPYPQPEDAWLQRELTKQDWATFINHLIPHHIDVTNRNVTDRNLKADLIDKKMQRLTLEHTSGESANLQRVPARLDQTQQPTVSKDAEPRSIDDILCEWNGNFFAPRRLRVNISIRPSKKARAMPGVSNHDSAENAYVPDGSHDTAPKRGFGWMRADKSGFHLGRNLLSADSNGFRLGRIARDIRCGPMVAESSRFPLGGNRGFDGSAPLDGNSQNHSRQDDGRPSELRDGLGGWGRHPAYGHESPSGRGPGAPDCQSKNRSRSSSISSTSSTSSSESDTSVGSLPDFDTLNDAQLPMAKHYISVWLKRPEQPITRGTVEQLKQEISGRAISVPFSDAERLKLRQDVKALMKTFRNAKRSQRSERRTIRRERKNQRRAAKRERRNQRRDAKRERRSEKREARTSRREAKREVKRQAKGKGRQMASTPAMSAVPSDRPIAYGSRGPPIDGSRVGWTSPVTSEAARVMSQADQLEAKAIRLQNEVRSMRRQAQEYSLDEKRRLIILEEADSTEREAGILIRESERMTAEAMQRNNNQTLLDRDAGRHGGQESGVINAPRD